MENVLEDEYDDSFLFQKELLRWQSPYDLRN